MKTYNQFCGVAYALDILGERWTLLIMRDLMTGSRRYRDLLEGLPGITTNLLARRLSHLVDASLIEKSSNGYMLTSKGRAAEPLVLALATIGSETLCFPPRENEVVSRPAMVLNLKRRYEGGCACTIGLVFKSESFLLTASKSSLDIGRLDTDADVTLKTVGAGLARWIIAGEPLLALIKGGHLMLEGKADTAFEFEAHLQTVPLARPNLREP